MAYLFRQANKNDREYLLNANKEINILSGLDDSTFEKNIDKDLFEDKICKSLIIEENGVILGFLLYSYVYWTIVVKVYIYQMLTLIKNIEIKEYSNCYYQN